MHTPFDNPWRTIVKTMTMTTGEFEFDSTFHQDREEYNSSAANPYLIASYLLWILFIIMMPILLTNLLVCRHPSFHEFKTFYTFHNYMHRLV